MTDAPENRFIANLSEADANALRPLLRRVQVTQDQTMVDQGAPVAEVHFPITAQFANLVRFNDGRAIETAVVGAEGITGLAPFMADRLCAWEIACRSGGDAYAASAQALRALARARPTIMERLLALTDLYQSQAAQAAACNAIHEVPARIARWILTASDLSPGQPLEFRQEELARLLGVRRTTVSENAARLKKAGLIAYGRGAVRVTDRSGLQALACECYAMLKPRLDDVLTNGA